MAPAAMKSRRWRNGDSINVVASMRPRNSSIFELTGVSNSACADILLFRPKRRDWNGKPPPPDDCEIGGDSILCLGALVVTKVLLVPGRRLQHVDSSLNHKPVKFMLQRVSRKIRHFVAEALVLEIQRCIA